MCSFLPGFLLLTVTFSLFQDFACINFCYLEAQGKAPQSVSQKAVVPPQDRKDLLDCGVFDPSQENYFQTPFEGRCLFEQYLIGNFSENGIRRCISMGMSMWTAQQENGYSMCPMLGPLDQGYKARCYPETASCFKQQAMGKLVERLGSVGQLGPRLGRLGKYWTAFLPITKKISELSKFSRRLFTERPCGQRQREMERQGKRQSQTGAIGKHFWIRQKWCSFFALLACVEQSGSCSIAVSNGSSQQEQYYARDGCSPSSCLQGLRAAGRCAGISGQSRQGIQSKQHQVSASCHEELRSCSKGVARCSQCQKRAPPSVDQACGRWNQSVGSPARKLQSAPGNVVGARCKSESRNRNIKKDFERGQRQHRQGREPLHSATYPRRNGASLDNAVDSEELKLRDQLQGVLNACAGSLGIHVAVPDQQVQEVSDDDKEKPPQHKRPRSVDPLRPGTKQ